MSRSSYDITSLEVTNRAGSHVANKFFNQTEGADSLALILPGLRYTCDMPLLYYTTEVLLIKGFDVLQLWSDYSSTEFASASQAEQAQSLLGDSQALIEAGHKPEKYRRTILVGKSIGTLSMALLLSINSELAIQPTIWLTPLLNLEPVALAVKNLKGPAYIAGSSADASFNTELSNQIQSLPNMRVDVIENADHSLRIRNDASRSLQVLAQVVTNLDSFIT